MNPNPDPEKKSVSPKRPNEYRSLLNPIDILLSLSIVGFLVFGFLAVRDLDKYGTGFLNLVSQVVTATIALAVPRDVLKK